MIEWFIFLFILHFRKLPEFYKTLLNKLLGKGRERGIIASQHPLSHTSSQVLGRTTLALCQRLTKCKQYI